MPFTALAQQLAQNNTVSGSSPPSTIEAGRLESQPSSSAAATAEEPLVITNSSLSAVAAASTQTNPPQVPESAEQQQPAVQPAMLTSPSLNRSQTSNAAASSVYSLTSLYVGDLAPEVTEASLFEKFSTAGPILSIRVCRDMMTRRSLGYAYVNFQHQPDADRALSTLNYDIFYNRPMRIMWSQRDPSLRKSGIGNVFIKNLEKTIDARILYDTFSVFGVILSCKVMYDEARESRGFGFVHFENAEAALDAIGSVNGMLIKNKKVYVNHFMGRHQRIRALGGENQKFTNVYIKNFADQLDDEGLAALFRPFGVLESVKVMRNEHGQSKGFGFVSFEKPENAEAAVAALNAHKLAAGRELYVGRAQKKAERLHQIRERLEEVRAERMNKYQGVNLYIKNLDDSVDDRKLNEKFAVFGKITSAKVMRDEAGNSRGFGFVCFTAPEEATRAVAEMNGRILGSKPLYVALAQRREERRQHLQNQLWQRMNSLRGVAQPLAQPTMLLPHGVTAAAHHQQQHHQHHNMFASTTTQSPYGPIPGQPTPFMPQGHLHQNNPNVSAAAAFVAAVAAGQHPPGAPYMQQQQTQQQTQQQQTQQPTTSQQQQNAVAAAAAAAAAQQQFNMAVAQQQHQQQHQQMMPRYGAPPPPASMYGLPNVQNPAMGQRPGPNQQAGRRLMFPNLRFPYPTHQGPLGYAQPPSAYMSSAAGARTRLNMQAPPAGNVQNAAAAAQGNAALAAGMRAMRCQNRMMTQQQQGRYQARMGQMRPPAEILRSSGPPRRPQPANVPDPAPAQPASYVSNTHPAPATNTAAPSSPENRPNDQRIQHLPRLPTPPFTIDEIRKSKRKDRMDKLGNYLHNYIQKIDAERSGKITGMLLALEEEILNQAIQNPDDLLSKILEAQVLSEAHTAASESQQASQQQPAAPAEASQEEGGGSSAGDSA